MKKMATKEVVLQIIVLNQKISTFWRNVKGWAPIEAANLLSCSRLDWQVSLSKSLRHWIGNKNLSDGDLILAWTNLGSLVEGTMKLFLSIFYEDYKKDIHSIKKKNGKLVNPDEMKLEHLKQFFIKQALLIERINFVDLVQQRRNAVHSFQNRNIGNYSEFCKALFEYYEFVQEIENRLPYPEFSNED